MCPIGYPKAPRVTHNHYEPRKCDPIKIDDPVWRHGDTGDGTVLISLYPVLQLVISR